MINKLSLTAVTYTEALEGAAGSEINPLNILLAVVYILVVMALIYVILLCIDKLAKKNKKHDVPPDEIADEGKVGDGEKDE